MVRLPHQSPSSASNSPGKVQLSVKPPTRKRAAGFLHAIAIRWVWLSPDPWREVHDPYSPLLFLCPRDKARMLQVLLHRMGGTEDNSHFILYYNEFFCYKPERVTVTICNSSSKKTAASGVFFAPTFAPPILLQKQETILEKIQKDLY